MKKRFAFAILALFGAVAPVWAAPIPTVCWDGDFDTPTKIGSDGVEYSFDRNGNTVTGGKLTIGNAAGLIKWSESSGTAMTVLVKYSSLGSPSSPATLLSFKTSADDDLGVRAQNNSSFTLVGYNTSGGTKTYGSKTVVNPAGYIVLTYDAAQKIAFISATTESKFSSSSFSSTALTTTGTMSGIALGGPNAAEDYPAWGGVVIEAVAVFRDYYSNTTTKYTGFRFPSELTTYAATVSGDVADLQNDGTIAWSGTALPSGGSSDAAVIWNMAAAANIAPTVQTKMFSLALTGAGNATFPGSAKSITPLQVFDLSDYSGVAEMNPSSSHSADASIKIGTSATLVMKRNSGETDTTVNSRISGDGTLVKDGVGKITFNETCQFTGTTTVSNGTLALGKDNACTPMVTVASPGMLDLNGKAGVTSLRLAGFGDGSSTKAALMSSASTAVPTRIESLALDDDATVYNVGSLSFGSDDDEVVTAELNSHTLTKSGNGAINLRNFKTGAGTLKIAGGSLTVAGKDNLGEQTVLVVTNATASLNTDESDDVAVMSVSNFGTIDGSARLVVSDAIRGSGSFAKVTALAGARLAPTDGASPLRIDDFVIPTGGIAIDASEIATDDAAAAGRTVKVVSTTKQISDGEISAIVHDSTYAWTVSRSSESSRYLLSLAPSKTKLRLDWRGGSGNWTATQFDGQDGFSDDARQNVTFCNAAEGEDPLTVTVVDGPRTVTRAVFSNDTRSVTLEGDGIVAYSIEKYGSAAVTVSSPFTLSGGIVIDEGTFVVDVPAGVTNVVSGGISGAGDLVKTGDGTLSVVGASGSWTGTLTVSGGVAKCGCELSFGTAEVKVIGGTVDLNGVYLSNPLAIAGEGLDDIGAIINSGASLLGTTGLAGLRLLADAAIGGDIGSYYWNAKTIDLAGHALTKRGLFKWPLLSNTFIGNGRVVIERGTFDTNQGFNDLTEASLSIQSHGALILGGDMTIVHDFSSISATAITGDATLKVCGTLDTDGATYTIPNLVFADEATLKGSGLTVSKSLEFGSVLNVRGLGCGSTALRYPVEDPTGYERVGVRVIGDSSRMYSFDYDTDTKSLFIIAKPIPPSFEMTAANVVYGVDMTNAVVKFTITDYDAGAGYSGDVKALLTVRDAAGNVVAERGIVVTGNGEYSFDVIDLLNGRTAGYSYDISVISRQTSTSDDERISGGGASEYVVHWSTNWVSENAESFLKPTGDPLKTGEWTGTARVVDDVIVHGESGDNLVFTANRKSNQNIVRVASTIIVEDGTDVPSVSDLPADAHAAFSIAADGGRDLVYVAITPALSAAVRLYSTGPSARPIGGSASTIAATFNYADGTVTFTADGNALTNAEGSAYLPISDAGMSAGKLGKVTFVGLGQLKTLCGDELNANLAKVGDTEYATLDEAIKSLPQGGTVEMLWDALWHPTMDDFGKRYFFTGDHSVVFDVGSTNTLASAGYAVVPNSDGSYSVSVIEYKLTFSANGASDQADYTQSYSVTNLAFALMANKFVATNVMDFAHWNAASDGSANTNYEDCAMIDMSRYGLTNMTLYAQWKVSVRTITIATPDPYVYLELVTTNAPYALPATHNGVRFYKTSGEGSDTSASFNVDHGSRVTIYFSTDIERKLVSDQLYYSRITADRKIPYQDLPKLASAISSSVLSEYELWAAAKSIPQSEFAASPFAMSSYDLNTNELLTEKSVVELVDFAVQTDGCSFRVLVDGVAISDRAAIADMILVSDDLVNWKTPAEGNVVISGETVRVITSDGGKFVKVVVPRD